MHEAAGDADKVVCRNVEDVEGNPRILHLRRPKSLVGLAKLTNLEHLRVTSSGAPEGMAEIARLPNLVRLAIEEGHDGFGCEDGDGVWDMALIAASSSIKQLDIFHHDISHPDAICDMTQLEELWLKGPLNGGRLERLPQMTQLRALRGTYDALGGLSAIGQLAQLRHLDLLSVPPGADFSPLGRLPELEGLDLGVTGETYIYLPFLPQLKRLQVLRGFLPCDPTTFGCLPQLESLTLGGWKSGDYSSLAGISQLKAFSVDRSDATSTKGLERCCGLTSLTIPLPSHCGDLSWCRSMPGLTRLSLWGATAVTSLAPMAELPELTELTLWHGNGLLTLADLPARSNLAVLHLDSVDSLESLQGIDALAELSELHLSGLPAVPDVEPLTRLPNLKIARLHLRKNSDPYCVMDTKGCYEDTAGFDGLSRCPALVEVHLDSDYRATELEANLALRRRDKKYVQMHCRKWVKMMTHGPSPEQTLPILLGVMVELLGRDDAAFATKDTIKRLKQWEQAAAAAREILGEL